MAHAALGGILLVAGMDVPRTGNRVGSAHSTLIPCLVCPSLVVMDAPASSKVVCTHREGVPVAVGESPQQDYALLLLPVVTATGNDRDVVHHLRVTVSVCQVGAPQPP